MAEEPASNLPDDLQAALALAVQYVQDYYTITDDVYFSDYYDAPEMEEKEEIGVAFKPGTAGSFNRRFHVCRKGPTD